MAVSATSTEDWTTKEKFILSCCVSRSGDQNWVSVSRTMKLIMEACGDGGKRAPEWYSQKNCATKYNQLLNTAFAAKRKVRGTSSESINVETPAEQILRKLTFKRIEELDQAIKSERERYKKLKADVEKIQSGLIDDQLPQIWNAIQSGQTIPLEQLIKSDEAESTVTKTTAQVANTPSLVASQALPSRPQRATKETEKFKSYIEQRQKHNAKYHHHNPSSSTTTTSSTVPPTVTFSQDLSSLSPTVGPSPAQVQNVTKSESSIVIPTKGLLITKNDHSKQQQQSLPQQQPNKISKLVEEQPCELPKQLVGEVKDYQPVDGAQMKSRLEVKELLKQKSVYLPDKKQINLLEKQNESEKQHRIVKQEKPKPKQIQQPQQSYTTSMQRDVLLQKNITEKSEDKEQAADVEKVVKKPQLVEKQSPLELGYKIHHEEEHLEHVEESDVANVQKEDEVLAQQLREAEREFAFDDEEGQREEVPEKEDEIENVPLEDEKEEVDNAELVCVKEEKVVEKAKSSDSKEASFLSSLLTAPTTAIKAQVNQLTEVLKEPIKNPHHISKESYEAYKKAQPPSPSPVAPVLSKLLGTSSPKLNVPKTESEVSPVKVEKKASPKKIEIDEPKSDVKPLESKIPPVKKVSLQKPSDTPEVVAAVTKSDNEGSSTSDQRIAVCPLLRLKSDEVVSSVKEKLVTRESSSSSSVAEVLKKSMAESIPSQELFPKTSLTETIPKRSSLKSPLKSPHRSPHKGALLKSSSNETSAEMTSNILPTEEKTYEELGTFKDSLTVDVGELNEIKVELAPSKDVVFDDSPIKKRPSETLLEMVAPKRPAESVDVSPTPGVTETLREVAEVIKDPAIIYSSKPKKKKGRRGGKKKSLATPMKIEIIPDEDIEHLNVGESGYLGNNKFLDLDLCDDDRKIKTPLTPTIPSPASPALSIGSNCDPELAQQQRAWRKSIMLVWKAAASHKYANIFLHPVTDEEAPGYSSIIYRPMDLSLIKKNIETGAITTTSEFQRDIMLMFQNALMYNRKEHDVYQMAQEMRDDVMEQIQSYISAQMMAQTADRDSKMLRGKLEATGHTRHSSKSGFSFLSL